MSTAARYRVNRYALLALACLGLGLLTANAAALTTPSGTAIAASLGMIALIAGLGAAMQPARKQTR